MGANDLARIPVQYRQLVDLLGSEATFRLCERYGGESLYIPKMDALQIIDRNEKIKKEYNGMNIKELSKRYGLSERWILKLVEGQEIPPLPGQMTIDDIGK